MHDNNSSVVARNEYDFLPKTDESTNIQIPTDNAK